MSGFNKGNYSNGGYAAPKGATDVTQVQPQNGYESSNAFNDARAAAQNQNGAQSAPPPNAVTPAGVAEAGAQAPGNDLIDGIAGILFAPGRAIIRLVNPDPGPKDLPMIILLSAATWYGAYWAFNKYVLEAKASKAATRKRLRRQIETEEIEDEDE